MCGMCTPAGARLETHTDANPWKSRRISSRVWLLCHIGVCHRPIMSAVSQKVAAWLGTYRSPADIVTQSDMDMAATIMDWSLYFHLWLESKWGATPQLPGDVNQKFPRSGWLTVVDVVTFREIFTSALLLVPQLQQRILGVCRIRFLEVVWSLLLRLRVLIHRVRANLKWITANKQIVGF